MRPRSRCPLCGAWLKWFELIPLLSYIRLRGRCRYCSGAISFTYPTVELLNGLLYAYLVSRFGLQPTTIKMAVFVSMMLVLVFTDLHDFLLPDEITLGGLFLGIALSPFIHLESGLSAVFGFLFRIELSPWMSSLLDSLLAVIILGGMLYVTGEFYFRVRKLEGLGLGDVKMIAMIGAFWGVGAGFTTLILSALIGAVSGVLIVVIGRKEWTYALPFGSYLGATAILVTLWGDDILRWYWQGAA